MGAESQEIRAEIIVTGKVQGVGFRAWVERLARARSLSGEVCNQADGTVRAIFEGNETLVREVIELCKQGPVIARVDSADVSFEKFRGEYQGFKVTY